ncbi:MAG: type IX secretion system sortase PorU, partial [Chitinophagaceae bacterium]|nr:type IX secretion system sortase PorU [Chitinophagaceae bacterium]
LSPASAQRSYAPNSVLSNGNWFKFSVSQPGIYKIDLAFLAQLGVSTSNLSSASVRIFGNGGEMLPEAANGTRPDDLVENAIWIEDGGDGIINASDYILIYANGPHHWIADSISKTFRHQKNLYSEATYYYLTIGGIGKRIIQQPSVPQGNTIVTTFNSHYFHELDTVNFLSSGKQWFGEEFSSLPGKSLTRSFQTSIPSPAGASFQFTLNAVARSFNSSSTLSIAHNNQAITTLEIPPVGPGPYDLFAQTNQSTTGFLPAGPNPQITITYSPGSFSSQAWLDWFEIHGRSRLSMEGFNQLTFRDWNSAGPGSFAKFELEKGLSTTKIWDVSNASQPIVMNSVAGANSIEFSNDASVLHEYIAFNNSGYLSPKAAGKVTSQNLHRSQLADLLIITHETLLSQAQRLAQYHRDRDGLKTLLVTATQVFNEFSSGIPDPAAMRDFVKMFYDRAGADTTKRPRYLLLFGDASFDYKERIKNNTNLVPAYESSVSLDPLSTYASDDFFGFLDDGDDINSPASPLLDIAIGRLPASDEIAARNIVDKIIAYHQPSGLGPWRNELSFIADDEDANLHLQDAETITNAAQQTAPVFNLDKIYLDAFRQEAGAGGSRYPVVNQVINSKIFNGTLIWNYSGHGGFRRLAEEVVLDQEIINSFNNPNRLPLFITATCDVAPFDNPLISSIGENLLLREKTGAIALMTTTRLVFAFSNRVMNENYLRIALQRKSSGAYPSLGEAVMQAKNFTYTFFGDVINNRKFTLLGDPALTIGLPLNKVQTTAINSIPIGAIPDTLKALDTYIVSGHITDPAGNPITDFNGTVYPVVFDKIQTQTTLANDPGSVPANFAVRKNTLFRGKAKVENGQFKFTFIVPKDIDYKFGNGKIAYYAENGLIDGNGLQSDIIIGGTGSGNGDGEGPILKAYLNDEKFVNGSITNSAPILLVKLTDSSGINVMGTGIGHDLAAMLDNDPEKTFVLNQFYEAELDNFRKGVVRFQLPTIEEGMHTLTIKAWDALNNSSELLIDFQVIKAEKLVLNHVLNYPNPFTTNTTFWFEHNHPNEELNVFVQVFTVSGKLVKTLRKAIFSTGNRSSEVEWNGRDEYGAKLARGVYVYRLRVRTSDGKAAEKWEKLYIL